MPDRGIPFLHQAIVVSGHMIDHPDRSSPRFPPEAEAGVTKSIAQIFEQKGEGENFFRELESTTLREIAEKDLRVVATGGLTVPKIGATPFGYRVAEQFGLGVIAPRPALVPLAFPPDLLARYGDLSGVSLDAEVRCGASVGVSLYPEDGEDAGPSSTTVPWIFVDDLDRHHDRVVAGGATVVTDIWHHGCRAYTAADLEGNRWTFAQATPRQLQS